MTAIVSMFSYLFSEELETIPETTTLSVGKKREQAGKEEALARILGAHVEMCVAIGNPYRGFTSLNYYRNRGKKKNFTTVRNINIYNTLLRGFAVKSNIHKVNIDLRLFKFYS